MPSVINHFLASLTCSLGGKYDYSKLMSAFYNWLYTPGSGLPFYSRNNSVKWIEALPSGANLLRHTY
jgi:hypothetical protein